MEPINKSFFDNIKYKRYKAIVLNKLKYFGIKLEPEDSENIEEYIKDFYADDFDEVDCAVFIRDHFKHRRFAMAEDFSMGVGASLGLDQGIPHSGDCKGVMPVRMQFVKSTDTKPNPKFAKSLKPQYWLNQIPKKKKRKKRVHENKELEGYSKEVYDYIKSNNLISNNLDDLKLNKYVRDQLNNLMEATIRAVKSKDIVGLFDVRKEAKKLKDELKNYVFENKKLVIESLAKFMLASTYFGQNNFDQGKYNLFLIHENIENLSHFIETFAEKNQPSLDG